MITRPEESSRLWCVVVWDLETSRIGPRCSAAPREEAREIFLFLLLRVQLMRLGIIHIFEFSALLGYSFLDFLTLEEWNDRLFCNSGKALPLYAAYCCRRAMISSASRRKLEITNRVSIDGISCCLTTPFHLTTSRNSLRI